MRALEDENAALVAARRRGGARGGSDGGGGDGEAEAAMRALRERHAGAQALVAEMQVCLHACPCVRATHWTYAFPNAAAYHIRAFPYTVPHWTYACPSAAASDYVHSRVRCPIGHIRIRMRARPLGFYISECAQARAAELQARAEAADASARATMERNKKCAGAGDGGMHAPVGAGGCCAAARVRTDGPLRTRRLSEYTERLQGQVARANARNDELLAELRRAGAEDGGVQSRTGAEDGGGAAVEERAKVRGGAEGESHARRDGAGGRDPMVTVCGCVRVWVWLCGCVLGRVFFGGAGPGRQPVERGVFGGRAAARARVAGGVRVRAYAYAFPLGAVVRHTCKSMCVT